LSAVRREAGDADGTAVIAVRGLEKRFGEIIAVAGVDFDVARGEMFGIVGPDGAGKTTILRMLAGVLPPTSGDARIHDSSVARDPEAVKARTAYMAQRFGLYEDLTVRENIDFYADLYRVPRGERAARLDRLYRFSALGPFRDRLVGNLSGGMKQKASLCCALIHQPEVLLLDEPTFGVDPISRRDLWLILYEMVAEGVTIVVSTSYLDEAERCDRVAMLHEGRLIALDSPAGLIAAHAGTLLAAPVRGDRSVRDRIRAVPGVSHAWLFGDDLHIAIEPSSPVPAHADFSSAGVDPSAVRRIEPVLEDVFLGLTAGAADG
jgi:ABC-2 type transport system ATP-binding protein